MSTRRFQKGVKKWGYIFVLFCVLALNLQPNVTVAAQTVPNLSFQADIHGSTPLERIEYPSTLAFTYWGGAGTTAHAYRSLLTGGDQIAFAIDKSTPIAFSFEVTTETGDQLTLSLASVDYPKGMVEFITLNELHFIWDINQSGLQIRLHRYVTLLQNSLVTVGNVIEEKYEIENIGPSFTLSGFSEYLRMDDMTSAQDYNNDGYEETLLAINNFTTQGYPVFGKVYLPKTGFGAEFLMSGNHATVRQNIPSQLINTGGKQNITWAAYVSSMTKNRAEAELEVEDDAVVLLSPMSEKPPLILIPGIGGSKLIYKDNQKEQWPRADYVICNTDSDRQLLSLRLNDTGTADIGNEIIASEILRRATPACLIPLPIFEQDFYDTTISTLVDPAKGGYQLGDISNYAHGDNLFLFPYDWRKDVGTSGHNLITFINQVRQQTGASQVDIFAHSMGGLVARDAIAKLKSTDQAGIIRKVLTLGTPVLGTPKALGILEYKSPCFVDDFPFIGCMLDPTTLQELATNFPSAYQLLPSPNYDMASLVSPLVISDAPQYYRDWSIIVAGNRNSLLLSQSKTFHNDFDNLTIPPSIQYVAVYGNNVPTPIQIIQSPTVSTTGVIDRVLWGKSGDGTVPAVSASLYNPSLGFDYRAGITVKEYQNVDHMNLVKNSDVLNDAITFLETTHNSYLDTMTDFQVTNVLSAATTGLEGTEIEIIGSVSGYILDSANNKSGQDDSLPEGVLLNIPGSFYFGVGKTHSYFLQNPDTYHAELNSAGDEASQIRVVNYVNDEIKQEAYFDVNGSVVTKMFFDVATGQDLSDLQLNIDIDGDGNVDEIHQPTNVIIPNPEAIKIMSIGPNPTNASNVNFVVGLSKTVTGVDAGDFALTMTDITDASIIDVSGSDAIYTVTVNTGSGDGTIRLDLVDDDSILDIGGNPLGGIGTGNGNFIGEVYVVNKTLDSILYMTENQGSLRVVDQSTAATMIVGNLGTNSINGISNRPGDTTYIFGVELPTVPNGIGPSRLVKVNTLTGETTTLPVFDESTLGIINPIANAVAISPMAPDIAVVTGTNIDGGVHYYLWKVDVDTGMALGPAIPMAEWLIELAYSLNGSVLYGVNIDGELVTVNSDTGDITLIGNPGLDTFIEGLAFRPSDGALFAIDGADHDRLIKLDPANGNLLEVIGPLGVSAPSGLAFISRP